MGNGEKWSPRRARKRRSTPARGGRLAGREERAGFERRRWNRGRKRLFAVQKREWQVKSRVDRSVSRVTTSVAFAGRRIATTRFAFGYRVQVPCSGPRHVSNVAGQSARARRATMTSRCARRTFSFNPRASLRSAILSASLLLRTLLASSSVLGKMARSARD